MVHAMKNVKEGADAADEALRELQQRLGGSIIPQKVPASVEELNNQIKVANGSLHALKDRLGAGPLKPVWEKGAELLAKAQSAQDHTEGARLSQKAAEISEYLKLYNEMSSHESKPPKDVIEVAERAIVHYAEHQDRASQLVISYVAEYFSLHVEGRTQEAKKAQEDLVVLAKRKPEEIVAQHAETQVERIKEVQKSVLETVKPEERKTVSGIFEHAITAIKEDKENTENSVKRATIYLQFIGAYTASKNEEDKKAVAQKAEEFAQNKMITTVAQGYAILYQEKAFAEKQFANRPKELEEVTTMYTSALSFFEKGEMVNAQRAQMLGQVYGESADFDAKDTKIAEIRTFVAEEFNKLHTGKKETQEEAVANLIRLQGEVHKRSDILEDMHRERKFQEVEAQANARGSSFVVEGPLTVARALEKEGTTLIFGAFEKGKKDDESIEQYVRGEKLVALADQILTITRGTMLDKNLSDKQKRKLFDVVSEYGSVGSAIVDEKTITEKHVAKLDEIKEGYKAAFISIQQEFQAGAVKKNQKILSNWSAELDKSVTDMQQKNSAFGITAPARKKELAQARALIEKGNVEQAAILLGKVQIKIETFGIKGRVEEAQRKLGPLLNKEYVEGQLERLENAAARGNVKAARKAAMELQEYVQGAWNVKNKDKVAQAQYEMMKGAFSEFQSRIDSLVPKTSQEGEAGKAAAERAQLFRSQFATLKNEVATFAERVGKVKPTDTDATEEIFREYQARARGWNIALTAYAKASSILEQADGLELVPAKQRVNVPALRIHAASLLQLANYASKNPEEVDKSIQEGKEVRLEKLGVTLRSERNVRDSVSLSSQAGRKSVVEVLQKATERQLTLLETLQEGAGTQAIAAKTVSASAIQITLASLGYRQVGANQHELLTLTQEQQKLLHTAHGALETVIAGFSNSVVQVKSSINVQQRSNIFNELASEARIYGQIVERTISEKTAQVEQLDNRRTLVQQTQEEGTKRIGEMIGDAKIAESNVRAAETTGKVLGSGLLLVATAGAASPFVAGFFTTESTLGYFEQVHQAGGTEGLAGHQHALAIGGIVLGATGFGLSVATQSGMILHTGMTAQLVGRGLMLGGLTLGIAQAPTLYSSFQAGEIGGLEVLAGIFGTMQPILQVAMPHALGAQRYANLMEGSSYRAQAFRGVTGLVFGASQAEARRMQSLAHEENFSVAYRRAGTEVQEQLGHIEAKLGRGLSTQEGLALLEHANARKIEVPRVVTQLEEYYSVVDRTTNRPIQEVMNPQEYFAKIRARTKVQDREAPAVRPVEEAPKVEAAPALSAKDRLKARAKALKEGAKKVGAAGVAAVKDEFRRGVIESASTTAGNPLEGLAGVTVKPLWEGIKAAAKTMVNEIKSTAATKVLADYGRKAAVEDHIAETTAMLVAAMKNDTLKANLPRDMLDALTALTNSGAKTDQELVSSAAVQARSLVESRLNGIATSSISLADSLTAFKKIESGAKASTTDAAKVLTAKLNLGERIGRAPTDIELKAFLESGGKTVPEKVAPPVEVKPVEVVAPKRQAIPVEQIMSRRNQLIPEGNIGLSADDQTLTNQAMLYTRNTDDIKNALRTSGVKEQYLDAALAEIERQVVASIDLDSGVPTQEEITGIVGKALADATTNFRHVNEILEGKSAGEVAQAAKQFMAKNEGLSELEWAAYVKQRGQASNTIGRLITNQELTVYLDTGELPMTPKRFGEANGERLGKLAKEMLASPLGLKQGENTEGVLAFRAIQGNMSREAGAPIPDEQVAAFITKQQKPTIREALKAAGKAAVQAARRSLAEAEAQEAAFKAAGGKKLQGGIGFVGPETNQYFAAGLEGIKAGIKSLIGAARIKEVDLVKRVGILQHYDNTQRKMGEIKAIAGENARNPATKRFAEVVENVRKVSGGKANELEKLVAKRERLEDELQRNLQKKDVKLAEGTLDELASNARKISALLGETATLAEKTPVKIAEKPPKIEPIETPLVKPAAEKAPLQPKRQGLNRVLDITNEEMKGLGVAYSGSMPQPNGELGYVFLATRGKRTEKIVVPEATVRNGLTGEKLLQHLRDKIEGKPAEVISLSQRREATQPKAKVVVETNIERTTSSKGIQEAEQFILGMQNEINGNDFGSLINKLGALFGASGDAGLKQLNSLYKEFRSSSNQSKRTSLEKQIENELQNIAKSVVSYRDYRGETQLAITGAYELPAGFRGAPETVRALSRGSQKAHVIGEIDTKTGSGAGVFRALIEVNGELKEVALKVFRDSQQGKNADAKEWKYKTEYFDEETKNAALLANMGLGPGYHGVVDIDGNPAFAMDFVKGKFTNDMTPAELKQYITEKTPDKVADAYRQLVAAGYDMGDFQYAVITEKQVINNRQYLPGDVVLWDPGSIQKIEPGQRVFGNSEQIKKDILFIKNLNIGKDYLGSDNPNAKVVRDILADVFKSDEFLAEKGRVMIFSNESVFDKDLNVFLRKTPQERMQFINERLKGMPAQKRQERLAAIRQMQETEGISLVPTPELEKVARVSAPKDVIDIRTARSAPQQPPKRREAAAKTKETLALELQSIVSELRFSRVVGGDERLTRQRSIEFGGNEYNLTIRASGKIDDVKGAPQAVNDAIRNHNESVAAPRRDSPVRSVGATRQTEPVISDKPLTVRDIGELALRVRNGELSESEIRTDLDGRLAAGKMNDREHELFSIALNGFRKNVFADVDGFARIYEKPKAQSAAVPEEVSEPPIKVEARKPETLRLRITPEELEREGITYTGEILGRFNFAAKTAEGQEIKFSIPTSISTDERGNAIRIAKQTAFLRDVYKRSGKTGLVKALGLAEKEIPEWDIQGIIGRVARERVLGKEAEVKPVVADPALQERPASRTLSNRKIETEVVRAERLEGPTRIAVVPPSERKTQMTPRPKVIEPIAQTEQTVKTPPPKVRRVPRGTTVKPREPTEESRVQARRPTTTPRVERFISEQELATLRKLIDLEKTIGEEGAGDYSPLDRKRVGLFWETAAATALVNNAEYQAAKKTGNLRTMALIAASVAGEYEPLQRYYNKAVAPREKGTVEAMEVAKLARTIVLENTHGEDGARGMPKETVALARKIDSDDKTVPVALRDRVLALSKDKTFIRAVNNREYGEQVLIANSKAGQSSRVIKPGVTRESQAAEHLQIAKQLLEENATAPAHVPLQAEELAKNKEFVQAVKNEKTARAAMRDLEAADLDRDAIDAPLAAIEEGLRIAKEDQARIALGEKKLKVGEFVPPKIEVDISQSEAPTVEGKSLFVPFELLRQKKLDPKATVGKTSQEEELANALYKQFGEEDVSDEQMRDFIAEQKQRPISRGGAVVSDEFAQGEGVPIHGKRVEQTEVVARPRSGKAQIGRREDVKAPVEVAALKREPTLVVRDRPGKKEQPQEIKPVAEATEAPVTAKPKGPQAVENTPIEGAGPQKSEPVKLHVEVTDKDMHEVEAALGLKKGTLLDEFKSTEDQDLATKRVLTKLKEHGFSFEADQLFNTDTTAIKWSEKRALLLNLLTTGKMLEIVTDHVPKGAKIVGVNYLQGMVGAFQVEVALPGGKRQKIFVKPQDTRAESFGARASLVSNIPSIEYINVGKKSLFSKTDSPTYVNPATGERQYYGISRNIADFEGTIRFESGDLKKGRDIKLHAIAASELKDVSSNPLLAKIVRENQEVVFEEFGYAVAGSMSMGMWDRRDANLTLMALEVKNPKDVKWLGDNGYRVFTENVDGAKRNFVVKFGNMDTDTAGDFRFATPTEDWIDFNPLYEWVGQEDMRRFFDGYARTVSTVSTYVDPTELVAKAFGTNDNGPIVRGMERWMAGVGKQNEYSKQITKLFENHDGEPYGAGRPIDKASQEKIRNGEGIPFLQASNGGNYTVTHVDGRATFQAEKVITLPSGENVKVGGIPSFETFLRYNRTQDGLGGTIAAIHNELNLGFPIIEYERLYRKLESGSLKMEQLLPGQRKVMEAAERKINEIYRDKKPKEVHWSLIRSVVKNILISQRPTIEPPRIE